MGTLHDAGLPVNPATSDVVCCLLTGRNDHAHPVVPPERAERARVRERACTPSTHDTAWDTLVAASSFAQQHENEHFFSGLVETLGGLT